MAMQANEQQQQQQQQQQPLKDVLTMKYVLGYRSDFKNNIFLHQDGQKLIYPAGNNIIINNNENKPPTFLQTYTGTRCVTSMAISPSRRYLAWSEECDNAILVIYDLKNDKKRTLSSLDYKSRQFIAIDFSKKEEAKYIVALTSVPDWQLIFFHWDKQKCISCGSVKISDNTKLTHCFFHPKEDNYVVVIGTGIIKPYIFSHTESQPKPLPTIINIKKDTKDNTFSQNFLSYCILKDQTIIVGTDMGELLWITPNCEYKSVLPQSPRQEQFAIQTLLPYSRGFLVGGQDCTVLIYEQHTGDIKNPYIRLEKKIQNKEFKVNINSLLLTNNEDNLIIGSENGQIYQVQFSSDRVISEENLKFEPVFLPFHSDKITGMDVCVRKALVATCSLDKTVRIWNYIDNTLEVMKEFEEEASALAFHPSGFHVIVAFVDKIRLLNIFEHDIVCFKELPIKGCKEISFSNGGHLFAITNASVVQVFQFYTGENPSNLVFKGQGKVRTIFWDEDDQGFYTGSSDGQVNYWRVDDQNCAIKTTLLTKPGFNVSCVISSQQPQQQERCIFISGSMQGIDQPDNEKCIYQIIQQFKGDQDKNRESMDSNKKKFSFSEPIPIITEANVSKIAMLNSGQMFFFGIEEKDKPGAIRVMRFPFTSKAEIFEIQSHYQGISRIKVSFDDNYIFTSGDDGVLTIYENKFRDSKIKSLDKEGSTLQFAEEFLIPREMYNESRREIDKLKQKIAELQFKQEQMTKEQNKIRDDKIKELQKVNDDNEMEEKEKYTLLEESKTMMEREYEEKKRKMKDQHEHNKNTIEVEYRKKIALEQSRNEDLKREKEKEYNKFNQEMKQLEEEHVRLMEDKKRKYEEQLTQEKVQYDELQKQQQEQSNKQKSDIEELEQKAESFVEQLKEENEEQMKGLFNDLDSSESIKRTKKTQFESEAQKLEEQRSKIKEILEDIQHIQEANKSLTKEKESHAKEIEEREKTIKDKSRRIYELKKKTQELEKFKFVLDYKIKELKLDIGPKEEEIAKMKEQIANMNAEILHFKRTNANLGLIVNDLHLRQKGMKKENEQQQIVILQSEEYIKTFQYDITECYQHVDDYKRLKQSVLNNLYNKYVVSDDPKKKKFETHDVQKEFIKERAHLETSVKGLKEKFGKNLGVHEQDNARIMKQNVDLLSEINDLKREKKALNDLRRSAKAAKENDELRIQDADLDNQLQMLQQEKERLQNEIMMLKTQQEELNNKLPSLQSPQQQQQQQQNIQ